MPKFTSPAIVIAALFISLAVFLLWFLSVALPVLAVEARFQYKATLRSTFGATRLRDVIWPQLRIKLPELGQNTQNGIIIPAIFVDEPVVYNVNPNDEKDYKAALRRGVAHAAGTGIPGSGNIGYYFAHSTTPSFVTQYNAVFYLLGKLKPGDEVDIWYKGTKTRYAVTFSKITEGSDVSFLSASSPEETIVLQTCWPPGTALKRMLVFAKKKNHIR